MKISNMRTRLLATSMIVGAAFAASATGALAQAAGGQEVVVTGSRIPQPNLTSVSPISAVTAQDFKLTGATDTIDTLNQLPQVGTGLTNTPNPLSGSSGFTTVNLRSLGAVRTLVLEDGKRLMPGDPTGGGIAPDLDTIPNSLIDRVEVVSGGASAVYGSDAISGVVNFVMKHNFQGVQLDAQLGIDEHDNKSNALNSGEAAKLFHGPHNTFWGGRTYTTSIVLGANAPDDKGNIEAYVSYRYQTPVYQHEIDYAACQVAHAGGVAGPINCTGSSNSNKFIDDNSGITYSVKGAQGSNTFVSGAARTQLLTPPASFNSNDFASISRQDERYQAGYFAHYDMSNWAQAYSDFSFMDDRSVSKAAPTALFGQTYLVNCNNPFLSAQQINAICTSNGLLSTDNATLTIGRRDVEGGARLYSYEHLSYKADIGVRGDVFDAWHYDVSGQFGRTQYNYSVQNDIAVSKAQDALLVGGTLANPVCLSGNSGCVPYNIFADGGVNAGALKYILTSGSSTGYTQEQIVNANVTGQLGKYGVKSPFAHDGVSVNVGLEYRIEGLAQVPDATSLAGDLSGAGGAAPPVVGSFNVREAFMEARAPLVQDKEWVKDLSFEAGFRSSEYSLAGNTNSYKLGANFSPTSDIRFRASFERATRAPNVNELYTPQLGTNTTSVGEDLCAPNDITHHAAASLAQCLNSVGPLFTAAQMTAKYGDGIDPAFGGSDKIQQCASNQCTVVTGGNKSLTPEIAKTYSVGFVATPRFIPGLDFSLDYFKIQLDNQIATFPISIAYNNCITLGTFCNLVVRDAQGSIHNTNYLNGGYVSGTNVNIGSIKTSGADVSAHYRFDLDKIGLAGLGRVSLSFNGTYTKDFITVIPVTGSFDCAGLFGKTCGAPLPKWKSQLRVTYITPWDVTVSGQWRYLGSTSLDGNTSQPLLHKTKDVNDATIPAYSYFDLSGTWTLKPHLTLRAGVNNVFDKLPPILDAGITGTGSPNSYTMFDLLGRQMFIGLTANF